jgi:hypothetical protein
LRLDCKTASDALSAIRRAFGTSGRTFKSAPRPAFSHLRCTVDAVMGNETPVVTAVLRIEESHASTP